MYEPIDWVACGMTDTVKSLFESGKLRLDSFHNRLGKTPLMVAAFNGAKDTVQTLLDKGADVNLKTIQDETAYDFAIKCGHTEVANMITMVH